MRGQNPEQKKRVALLLRDSQAAVMFACERSARGHMKSRSIAQRGEGGARGGSGELKRLPEASPIRNVMLLEPKNRNFFKEIGP